MARDSVTAGDLQRITCKNIWGEVREGRAIPVLGAGASFVKEGASPVLGKTLQQQMAQKYLSAATDVGLAELAAIVEAVGVGSLKPFLKEQFDQPSFQIPPLYERLATVQGSLTVITTNYDRLLDTAFKEKPHHLVVYCHDNWESKGGFYWRKPSEKDFRLSAGAEITVSEEETLLVQCHGSVIPAQPTFVITDDDYSFLLYRMTKGTGLPTPVIDRLRRACLFFIGHALGDIDLHVLRTMLTFDHGQKTHYAVLKDPQPWQEHVWATRGVKLLSMNVDAFLAHLDA